MHLIHLYWSFSFNILIISTAEVDSLNTQFIKKEFLAGLTTFLTMSYVIVVNPSVLSNGTGLSFSGVLTATVLLAFSCTLAMGLYAKLPYAVAPGMGINAFFTYTLILGQNIPWTIALGLVFWSGVLFLIFSLTPIRENIVKAMPVSVRQGASIGIGIFLTFIGLKNSGIVVQHPVTFVSFGQLNMDTLFLCVGLLICFYFVHKKNSLAFLFCILFVTAISWLCGKTKIPDELFSVPDFHSVFLKADILGALNIVYLAPILSILFTDLFDSISTFVGLSEASGLIDSDGEPKNLKQGLIVDAWATTLAGLFGTSSGTAYIESAAGVEAGGRSGLTAVFTALLFIPCFFIGPIVQMIPPIATAPVLVVIGYLMFSVIHKLRFQNLEDGVSAYLTIIMIPLCFSITQGLLWGILSYISISLIRGKAKSLSKSIYFLGFLCLLLFYLNH